LIRKCADGEQGHPLPAEGDVDGDMARELRRVHPPRMQILGLDHVQLAIPCDGLETARAFYGSLLGFEEEQRPESRNPGIWYLAPRTILHLGVEEPFTPARKAHAAFLVADLSACQQELEAAGHAITPARGARFHAFDPFGNRLEFLQSGEGFSER
jgi:catechol 2,3-dioxygenase-like lactoylglutathione lyase family enzyme